MPHRLRWAQLDEGCQFGKRTVKCSWVAIFADVRACTGGMWSGITKNLYVRFWHNPSTNKTWGLVFLDEQWFLNHEKDTREWTGGRGMEVFLRSLLCQRHTQILKWAPCKWKPVPMASWAKENSWLGLKKCQINSFSLLLSRPQLSLQSRSGLRAVLAGLSWTSCCDEIAVIPGFPQI